MPRLLANTDAERAVIQARLDRLWRTCQRRELKFAACQNGSPLMPAGIMPPWEAGEYTQAITAMYANYEHNPEFTNLTRERAMNGLTVQRIQVVNEHLPRSAQWYLGALVEYFRRINVTLGGEDVFVVPRSRFPDFPNTDAALFDNTQLVLTHYRYRGKGAEAIAAREFFSGEDPVGRRRMSRYLAVAERIAPLLPECQLPPANASNATPWMEDPNAANIRAVLPHPPPATPPA